MTLAPRSTGAIAQSLSGIDFPANKQKLVDWAKKNNADQEIVNVLQNMPDEQYVSMADVFKGVGISES